MPYQSQEYQFLRGFFKWLRSDMTHQTISTKEAGLIRFIKRDIDTAFLFYMYGMTAGVAYGSSRTVEKMSC
ncbi:hypothetical protein KSX_55090 [Ktedonospora formicarum]|uniref:Uncharacterized protein n=1 Tax=Ktedonospora formicarum TaxID=2778364 RepID=A0A8J3I223_9CHLR|nr:hypothetical protein KSX_55090 [Ktedonospora formicarum]